MKVRVIRWGKFSYRVEVVQGVQSFRINYDGTRDDCRWMARMFRKALKAHDAEQKKQTRR